ncbi:polysaccharide lyase [Microvirga pakistanensis]|uniref:polysaccharide lyase n=1 Tax=Microvirga pakistanensis TaxID=1682650 RepID=UPI00106A3D42|nr:polysaccharide lyase [Microvirga pakistanensis]
MLPFGNSRKQRRILTPLLLLAATILFGHVGYSLLYYLHNLEYSEGPAFNSSFESGTVSSWADRGEVEFCCDHSKTFVAQDARHGSQALRITLRKDDPLVAGGKRAELRLKPVGVGEDQWYAFSLLLPEEAQKTSEIVTVAQWHAVDDKILGERGRAPPLRLIVHNGTWNVVTTWDNRFISGVPFLHSEPQGGMALWAAPVDGGAWTDWVFHVKWSYREDGLVQIWKDGVSIVEYKGPNAYNDLIGPFFKVGVYVPAWKLQDARETGGQLSVIIDNVSQSREPLPTGNQRDPGQGGTSRSSNAHGPTLSRSPEPAGHSASAATP